MVREERLELSHLAAPEPKSGVSTNSTTPALHLFYIWIKMVFEWGVSNINIHNSYTISSLHLEKDGSNGGIWTCDPSIMSAVL